ncbi:MAG: LysR family transcriptional regulator [Lachnospiraceae bacterium]|nr:LysR family transcriptional regulator [Lachnospiraceae bacterium]
MDINFEYYKIFYYVAKYRNITKAATALGSNQPNVTRIMKLLEAQLNCRLFVREARGISLTEEGELLYSHVEVAYRHLLNAQEEIGRPDSPGRGTVEIGVTDTALHLFLLSALHDFKREFPAIRIKIHNHTTLEIVKQLVSGKLDFAVITTPFDIPKTFSCEKVLDFKEILAGGVQYQSLCGMPMELEELKDCSWVGLGRGSATYELYRNFFLEHKLDMELDMEVTTSDLMLPLLESNLGIGFVPETLAYPLLEKKTLVQIPVKCAIPRRSIQIVSDRGRGKSLAADTFYKYLEARRKADTGYES